MKSGKRKRDDENDDSSSSSEEERVEVKKRKAKGANWSKEEEMLLKRLKGKSLSWEKITKSFRGRTANGFSRDIARTSRKERRDLYIII
jgi:hypothetical protein